MVQRITEFINTAYSSLGAWPLYIILFYNNAVITMILVMGLLKKKLPRKTWRFREAGSIAVFLLVASLAFSAPEGGQIVSMRSNIWRVYDSTQVTPVEPQRYSSDEMLGVGESTEITDGTFTFHIENTGDVPLRDIEVEPFMPIEYEIEGHETEISDMVDIASEIMKSILSVLTSLFILYSLLRCITGADAKEEARAYEHVKMGVILLIGLWLFVPLTDIIKEGAANQTGNLAETHTFIPVHVVVTNNGNEPLSDLELTLDGTVLEPTWTDTDTLDILPAGKSSEAVVYLESEDEVKEINISARSDAHTQAVGTYAYPLFIYCMGMGTIGAISFIAHIIRRKKNKLWLFWAMRSCMQFMLGFRVLEGTRFPLLEFSISCIIFFLMSYRIDPTTEINGKFNDETPRVEYTSSGIIPMALRPVPQATAPMNAAPQAAGINSGSFSGISTKKKKGRKRREENKRKAGAQ